MSFAGAYVRLRGANSRRARLSQVTEKLVIAKIRCTARDIGNTLDRGHGLHFRDATVVVFCSFSSASRRRAVELWESRGLRFP